MTTWNELSARIRSTYKVADEKAGILKLIFDLGNGRSQLVLISREVLMGSEEWFSIASPIGDASQINLGKALERVGSMVCGALAQTGRVIVLRHSAPLANLDINEFERPLLLVTTTADRLERELAGGDQY